MHLKFSPIKHVEQILVLAPQSFVGHIFDLIFFFKTMFLREKIGIVFADLLQAEKRGSLSGNWNNAEPSSYYFVTRLLFAFLSGFLFNFAVSRL